MPGLVDLSACLREPGFEYKATIKSESIAAAHGGITSLCCPPNTDPVIDTPAAAELIHRRSQLVAKTKVYPLGAITKDLAGKRLSDIFLLKEAGCLAVSNAYSAIDDGMLLRRCFEYAASCKMPVFLFAEDASLRNNGVAHEGFIGTRLGLPVIPETAETVAVSRALLLAEQTGVRVHFCRLSTARAVDMISAAKRKKLPVTADVNICQLHLTEHDVASYDSLCYLRPPLRSLRDREALIAGVKQGTVTAVCSDHQPHDTDAKMSPFSLTEPGASTIEILLPLLLHLVQQGKIDLQNALAAVTCRPAKIIGIPAGTLGIGRAADVCIFDPEQEWTIDRKKLISAGKNSPFHRWKVKGKVNHTLLNGKIIVGKI